MCALPTTSGFLGEIGGHNGGVSAGGLSHPPPPSLWDGGDGGGARGGGPVRSPAEGPGSKSAFTPPDRRGPPATIGERSSAVGGRRYGEPPSTEQAVSVELSKPALARNSPDR